MDEFFNSDVGNTIPWFGVTHILLLFGFALSIGLLWFFSKNIKNSKYEVVYRYVLIGIIIVFEWSVFESRMLTNSVFRMPLCAVSLYGLTFSVVFRKEKAFKIFYFYIFGAFMTFLFFDTTWGLNQWGGVTFFGAHACIVWLAVYGVKVLDYRPKLIDFYRSITFLATYAFIAGYATKKYGGSDELFIFSPPIAEAQFLVDIHPLLYFGIFSLLVLVLMGLLYLPFHLIDRKNS